jgi:hypothetical protein
MDGLKGQTYIAFRELWKRPLKLNFPFKYAATTRLERLRLTDVSRLQMSDGFGLFPVPTTIPPRRNFRSRSGEFMEWEIALTQIQIARSPRRVNF